MPEDLPGDPSDGVVSKFWLGFVFPGRVLLWRALRESGSCLVFVFVFYFLWINCLTFCYLTSCNQKQLGNQ